MIYEIATKSGLGLPPEAATVELDTPSALVARGESCHGAVFTLDPDPALSAHPAHGRSRSRYLARRVRSVWAGLRCRGATLDRAAPIHGPHRVRELERVGGATVFVEAQRAAQAVPLGRRAVSSSNRASRKSDTCSTSAVADSRGRARATRARGGAGVGLRFGQAR